MVCLFVGDDKQQQQQPGSLSTAFANKLDSNGKRMYATQPEHFDGFEEI